MNQIKDLFHYNPIIIHNWLLSASIALFALSILSCTLNKYTTAILLLFVASLSLNYFLIHLDPFLNSWDERFHCLVAKNMISNPFKPMLYTQPLLPFDYTNWSGNYIWVHKQPLFLWQMALSLKLFGVSEVSARLPSAIMVSLLGPVVYRMGKLLVNARVGYVAALLMVTNNFILEHASGKQELEHNDLAFMFYVVVSIWAWIEYEKSGNRNWLFAAGIFSGCSILIKWLTGLLVFAGFGVYHGLLKKDIFNRSNLGNLLLAGFLCVSVFLPWQVYILSRFPMEAHCEYALNARHFMEVLQGHGGSLWFYLQNLSLSYSILYPLVFIGIAISIFRMNTSSLLMALAFLICITYLFYSIAATKMSSFVMPVAPLSFLFMGVAIDYFFNVGQKIKLLAYALIPLLLLLLCLQNLSIDKIAANHWRNTATFWGKFAQNTADNSQLYRKLSTMLPSNAVIGYCNQFEEIDCMFYSGVTSYAYLNEEDFKILKNSGRRIAVFNNHLPEFISNDTSVFIIPADYKINGSSIVKE